MDKKEFEEIRRKAEQGNAEAQCKLGDCYFCGDVVEENDTEAVKWYDCVHFYPYNNKWFVDCAIKEIHFITVDEEF